jgi:tRNA modification GTPase
VSGERSKQWLGASHGGDNIVAVATPAGSGAIGIVRVSGPDLTRVANVVLGGTPPARQGVLSFFRDEHGSVIDQGIALFFPAPESFTGEHVLELHGHGGPAVLARLVRTCIALGARSAEPGEFAFRAFLNDKIDLAQAEGIADLIAAGTEEAARCAVRSLTGDFSRAIESLCRELVDLRVWVEGTLDFPDEEIEFLESSSALGRLQRVRDRIAETIAASRQGSLLREGIRVVLAGPPNVGKSSLLNRLAGEAVAIVTDIPGTTRDPIRQILQIRGVPMHVIDTAGLRESSDVVERLGIERAWSAIENADVVVLIREAGVTQCRGEPWVEKLPSSLPQIEVVNKIDLTGETPCRADLAGRVRVRLSALTGAGIAILEDALLAAVGWQGREEGLFMARERHLEALRAAETLLAEAENEGRHLEIMAEQLRLAHDALTSILGQSTPDDLLGKIFSRFCIGK